MNRFVTKAGAGITEGVFDLILTLAALFHLQKLVNQQWFGMQSTDKQEIRRFFTQFLMSNHMSCPTYIQKKLAKVYVNIGRLDWPQFFPDFYHNILQVKHHFEMPCFVQSNERA